MTPPQPDAPEGVFDAASAGRRQASDPRAVYAPGPWTSAEPARLETIGKLWGLEAAPAGACRMLELGCGDGGNLIPLAIAHPGSHFVGLEPNPRHIETARGMTAELEVGNTRFEAGSLVDCLGEEAPFDYIVAYDLMSWVTPDLQATLLSTCKRLLAPRGIAVIRYNTYPGWHMQHGVRQILRRHTRDVGDIDLAVERSGQLLDALARSVPAGEPAYREYLERIGQVARDPASQDHFAHDYLGDENHPFFVSDFIERSAAHGLQYLGDADLVDAELDNIPEEPAKLIQELAPDATGRIQMLDFAANRTLRQSLVCHDDVAIRSAPDLSRVGSMYIASQLTPDDDAGAVDTPLSMQFSDRHGRTIELDQPVAKAALMYFVEVSPQPIAFEPLIQWSWDRAEDRPPGASPEETGQRQLLAVVFGRLLLADMVEVMASPPWWATDVPERPRVSALTRRAAAKAQQAVSLRHRSISFDDEAVRAVLRLLDGSRDRKTLVDMLAGRVDAKELDRILELAARHALLLPDS